MNAGDLTTLAPETLSALRCPVCRGHLDEDPTGVTCGAGHHFDRARQGYLDLSGGRVTHPGDTPDMIAARSSLLSAGHLSTMTQAIGDALVHEVGKAPEGLVVDVGAGPGHHLAMVLEANPLLHGLAIDVSKAALRRAARAHRDLIAIRADIWRGLPVQDSSALAILDVFAPRSSQEFHRILKPDGVLITVTPTRDHLAELVEPLGLITVDPRKQRRLVGGFLPLFCPIFTWERTTQVQLSRAHVRAMVLMGPSAWHVDHAVLATKLDNMDDITVASVSIRVAAWRPIV